MPEVGWLWAAAGGTSSSGAAVPNPSARMTVADLRQDRIKAKKCAALRLLLRRGTPDIPVVEQRQRPRTSWLRAGLWARTS